MQARLHENEMYLVTVTQAKKTKMRLLTDNLEIALNTARTVEKFGFHLQDTATDFVLIWAFHVNVHNEHHAPIFERRWVYKNLEEGNDWTETWHSSIHKLLAKKLEKDAARRRRALSRR